jgi:hypothetical protein
MGVRKARRQARQKPHEVFRLAALTIHVIRFLERLIGLHYADTP